jgi:hypothetical protein
MPHAATAAARTPTAAGAAKGAISRLSYLAARIVQVMVVLFLLFDGGARAAGFQPYIDGTTKYGYPESYALGIGLGLLFITLLYAIPRTALLGALLLTAYLGGGAASHIRVGEPFYFPVVVCGLAWLTLYRLDPRMGAATRS